MAMPEQRLQEFLDKQQDGFAVNNDNAANWALRKIKSFKDQKEQNTAYANEEIEKINNWLEKENETLDNSISHFESLLALYALELQKKDKNFKSRKLPGGSFGFRKSQPKWHYEPEKAVASLEQQGNHDLIRIKKEPDKAAIKKYFKVANGKAYDPTTGEELDGVMVQDQPDIFSVKVDA